MLKPYGRLGIRLRFTLVSAAISGYSFGGLGAS